MIQKVTHTQTNIYTHLTHRGQRRLFSAAAGRNPPALVLCPAAHEEKQISQRSNIPQTLSAFSLTHHPASQIHNQNTHTRTAYTPSDDTTQPSERREKTQVRIPEIE